MTGEKSEKRSAQIRRISGSQLVGHVFVVVLFAFSLVSIAPTQGPILAVIQTPVVFRTTDSTQPSASWVRSYGGANHDGAFSLQQTSDGGFVVAGYTTSFGQGREDIWVVRLDGDGNIRWQKAYGGSGTDIAFSVQQTNDGGFVVCGYTTSFGEGGASFWILRLDGGGNIQWQETYGYGFNDKAFSIRQTFDGGFVAVGFSLQSFATNVWILKLGPDGGIQWQNLYYNANYSGYSDVGFSVWQTSDEGFVIAGTTAFSVGPEYTLGPVISRDSHMWVLKLDARGYIGWAKEYGPAVAHSLQGTSDGGFVVAGTVNSQFWILELNELGNVEWQRSYGTGHRDEAFSVRQTSDGGFVVAGSSGDNLSVLRTDSKGEPIWQNTYGGTAFEDSRSAQQTSDGGFIAAGRTRSFGAGGNDAWLLKLDATGNLPGSDLAVPSNSTIKETHAEPKAADFNRFPSHRNPIKTTAVAVDTSGTSMLQYPGLSQKQVTLESFLYEDKLPEGLDALVEETSFKDTAVLGDFHAVLAPVEAIGKAEVEVTAEYKEAGSDVFEQETRHYTLALVGNAFVANIKLETIWPFEPAREIADWSMAIICWRMLKDPRAVVEQVIGETVNLPEFRTYIGFEKVYVGAKVTKIVGVGANGNDFEIQLEAPLPLKTSYQKLADSAKGTDYLMTQSMSPVALSVLDQDGHRIGAYENRIYREIQNAYYIGEPERPQLVIITRPVGRYTIEIEGLGHGVFALQVAARIMENITEKTLAERSAIELGTKNTYEISPFATTATTATAGTEDTSTSRAGTTPLQTETERGILGEETLPIAIVVVVVVTSVGLLTYRRVIRKRL